MPLSQPSRMQFGRQTTWGRENSANLGIFGFFFLFVLFALFSDVATDISKWLTSAPLTKDVFVCYSYFVNKISFDEDFNIAQMQPSKRLISATRKSLQRQTAKAHTHAEFVELSSSDSGDALFFVLNAEKKLRKRKKHKQLNLLFALREFIDVKHVDLPFFAPLQPQPVLVRREL